MHQLGGLAAGAAAKVLALYQRGAQAPATAAAAAGAPMIIEIHSRMFMYAAGAAAKVLMLNKRGAQALQRSIAASTTEHALRAGTDQLS